jgi:hypothetical protein
MLTRRYGRFLFSEPYTVFELGAVVFQFKRREARAYGRRLPADLSLANMQEPSDDMDEPPSPQFYPLDTFAVDADAAAAPSELLSPTPDEATENAVLNAGFKTPTDEPQSPGPALNDADHGIELSIADAVVPPPPSLPGLSDLAAVPSSTFVKSPSAPFDSAPAPATDSPSHADTAPGLAAALSAPTTASPSAEARRSVTLVDDNEPPPSEFTRTITGSLGESLPEAAADGGMKAAKNLDMPGDMSSSSSSSGSISSSSDSSDTDSDSDSSSADERERILRSLVTADEEKADDEGPLRTKNETNADELEISDLEIVVSAEHTLVSVGRIKSIMDKAIVVESLPDALASPSKSLHPYALAHDEIANSRALDSDTVLCCIESRKPIGRVFETFGPVTSPFYIVRFNSNKEIEALGDATRIGQKIAYVSELCTMVRAGDIRNRGYDASNLYDEELVNERQEYSDDESEAAAKRVKKRPTDGAGLRGMAIGDAKGADGADRRPQKRPQFQSHQGRGALGNFQRGTYRGGHAGAVGGSSGLRSGGHTGWPSNRNHTHPDRAQPQQSTHVPHYPQQARHLQEPHKPLHVQPPQQRYGHGGPVNVGGLAGPPPAPPVQMGPLPQPIYYNGIPAPSIHPMLAQHNQFAYQQQPPQQVIHPYGMGGGGPMMMGGGGAPMVLGAGPGGLVPTVGGGRGGPGLITGGHTGGSRSMMGVSAGGSVPMMQGGLGGSGHVNLPGPVSTPDQHPCPGPMMGTGHEMIMGSGAAPIARGGMMGGSSSGPAPAMGVGLNRPVQMMMSSDNRGQHFSQQYMPYQGGPSFFSGSGIYQAGLYAQPQPSQGQQQTQAMPSQLPHAGINGYGPRGSAAQGATNPSIVSNGLRSLPQPPQAPPS